MDTIIMYHMTMKNNDMWQVLNRSSNNTKWFRFREANGNRDEYGESKQI